MCVQLIASLLVVNVCRGEGVFFGGENSENQTSIDATAIDSLGCYVIATTTYYYILSRVTT